MISVSLFVEGSAVLSAGMLTLACAAAEDFSLSPLVHSLAFRSAQVFGKVEPHLQGILLFLFLSLLKDICYPEALSGTDLINLGNS